MLLIGIVSRLLNWPVAAIHIQWVCKQDRLRMYLRDQIARDVLLVALCAPAETTQHKWHSTQAIEKMQPARELRGFEEAVVVGNAPSVSSALDGAATLAMVVASACCTLTAKPVKSRNGSFVRVTISLFNCSTAAASSVFACLRASQMNALPWPAST